MIRASIPTIAALIGLLAARGAAQEVLPFAPPALPRPLEPVVADSNVLSTSLRVMEPGLNAPSGFEQVYGVPGREDLRMRVNGGLYAVFPESAYIISGRTAVAIVPAGTVFFIGEPTPDALGLAIPASDGAGGREQADRGQHLRYDRRIAPPLHAPPRIEGLMELAPVSPHLVARWSGPTGQIAGDADVASGPPTIVTDAAYRSRRIRELMQAAANAQGSRPHD